jgi:pyrimidine-specific ribonucleoside hydrolase
VTKIPVVIDTDMGFDDWMAILYLLNSPKVSVEAITVDCAGETYCPQGAVNATKLLKLAGKAYVPVYYGEEPKFTLPYQFPPVIRDGATSMQVPGFEALPATDRYGPNAAQALEEMVSVAAEQGRALTILSIGTATNLADALNRVSNSGDTARIDRFFRGIAMIYKGGGAVGEAEGAYLTNNNIPGNIAIPGIFQSDNTTAEWNIYANAPSTDSLFRSGLPVTLVTVNLSDQVAITEQSYDRLSDSAKTPSAEFVAADIISNIDEQGGWDKAELDYWDPSVVVAAVNPDLVTTQYANVLACVDVSSDKAIHGTTFVHSRCELVEGGSGNIAVYTGIDVDGFYNEFIDTLNRE